MEWHADYQDIATFFFVVTLVLAPTALGFAIAWKRERRRRLNADRIAAEAETARSGYAQLQTAIESVALEVERIGEIERFAVQQLAVRPSDAELRKQVTRAETPHVVTPH